MFFINNVVIVRAILNSYSREKPAMVVFRGVQGDLRATWELVPQAVEWPDHMYRGMQVSQQASQQVVSKVVTPITSFLDPRRSNMKQLLGLVSSSLAVLQCKSSCTPSGPGSVCCDEGYTIAIHNTCTNRAGKAHHVWNHVPWGCAVIGPQLSLPRRAILVPLKYYNIYNNYNTLNRIF